MVAVLQAVNRPLVGGGIRHRLWLCFRGVKVFFEVAQCLMMRSGSGASTC
jgi:hypothetical protein